MEVYLVGGAVRDELLGVTVTEQDWVITGATREELLENDFKPVGKSFPVFLHPDTKEEYALARTEKKVAGGYHGFDFDASPSVSLEEDLLRRDLTINAMAKNADGEIIDPYGGLTDLADRILRHVSDAFAEDPVRVLRVARFMARYERFGFKIAPKTIELMQQMALQGELEFLVPERVWREMSRALEEQAPVAFFQTLRECGALHIILPELDQLYQIPQEEDIHPERNVGTHTELTLRQVAHLTEKPWIRFAALLHDIGKSVTPKSNWPEHPNHHEQSQEIIRAICERLNVPNNYKDLALLTARYYGEVNLALKWNCEQTLDFLDAFDVIRKPERFWDFLLAAKSIFRGRLGKEHDEYPQQSFLTECVQVMSAMDTKSVLKDIPLNAPKEIKAAIRSAKLALLAPIQAQYQAKYQTIHKRE